MGHFRNAFMGASVGQSAEWGTNPMDYPLTTNAMDYHRRDTQVPAGRTGDMSRSNGSSSADYSAVDLPDKPRTEWHYTHRRAELLQLIREAGHPDELNQTELAEKYGVSQQQISKDLDRLGEHVRQSVDLDRRALVVNSVVQRCIRGMVEDGDYRQAARTALEWDEWAGGGSLPTGDDIGTPDSLPGLIADFENAET